MSSSSAVGAGQNDGVVGVEDGLAIFAQVHEKGGLCIRQTSSKRFQFLVRQQGWVVGGFKLCRQSAPRYPPTACRLLAS